MLVVGVYDKERRGKKKERKKKKEKGGFAVPAPVVPPVRDDPRIDGLWQMVYSVPARLTSTDGALGSTKPRFWEEMSSEYKRNVSVTSCG